jgi:hypothetical protein
MGSPLNSLADTHAAVSSTATSFELPGSSLTRAVKRLVGPSEASPVDTKSTENRPQFRNVKERLKSLAVRTRSGIKVDPCPFPTFIVMEYWEGVVDEIFDTYFRAHILSLTTPEGDEVAEVYRTEVSPADEPLLRPGAVFYWTIGYEDAPSGQRKRQSFLRFRRLPPISPTNEPVGTQLFGDEWVE